MNVLLEMTSLFSRRPGPHASGEAVAAWYRAKGQLHEHIAAAGGRDAPMERAYAAASYEHARRLEQCAARCGEGAR